MKVQDAMTVPVVSIQATDSIAQAALAMANKDVGMLPVLDGDQLVGVVTDRDIAVRAVADPIDLTSSVRSVMTDQVTTCSPLDDVDDALGKLGEQQIRRLLVCDDLGSLVGIFSLADACRANAQQQNVGKVLAKICKPSGHHCQATVYA